MRLAIYRSEHKQDRGNTREKHLYISDFWNQVSVSQIFFKKSKRMDRNIQKQMNQTVFQMNNITMLVEKIYIKKIKFKKTRQNQLKYL